MSGIRFSRASQVFQKFFNSIRISDDYTTDANDYIGVTDTSAVRTITISSKDITREMIITIKDESGAAGINKITIETEASETIDGESSINIDADYGCLKLVSDGTNLYTL